MPNRMDSVSTVLSLPRFRNMWNAIPDNMIQKDQWAVGGGTILSEIYHHRLSKDIDIFVDDVQFISALSPKINDASSEGSGYAILIEF